MKAFLFSDLHVNYKQLSNLLKFLEGNEEIDAVICAGDIVNMGEPIGFMETFIDVVDKVGKPFFWVPGNNDFGRAYYKLFAKYPSLEGRVESINNVISTPCEARAEESSISFKISPPTALSRDDKGNAICLTGVGGSPASWAGQYAGEKLIDKKLIGGSIFISHVPPPGVHNYRHEDCNSPTAKKLSDSPLVHICGHIHHQWGCAYLGSTKIIKLAAFEYGQYAILDLETLEVEFERF